MNIPSGIKIDITEKFISILSKQLFCCLATLHFITISYFSSQNSFIMLVNNLLFQHYSCQICNLLFLKLCQHNRLRPIHCSAETTQYLHVSLTTENAYYCKIRNSIKLFIIQRYAVSYKYMDIYTHMIIIHTQCSN